MGTPMVLSWLETQCKDLQESWEKSKITHLTSTLASRSKIERQQMRDTYKAMYDEDISRLFERVGNGCEEEVSNAFSLWMLSPYERDAVVLREAIRRHADADYKVAVDVFAGRKSSHVALIKHAYYVRFRRQLDQEIMELEPPHSYQKILMALATSHKANHTETCHHTAKCDARRLFEAGEGGGGGIDEGVIIEMLSKRSLPQMKLTFSAYKRIYGEEYTKVLKEGGMSEFEDALINVVKLVSNPPRYYAKEMHECICGSSSVDKRNLMRLIMSRADLDMDEISMAYEQKYGKGLIESILESVPSGDYPNLMISLAKRKNINACL